MYSCYRSPVAYVMLAAPLVRNWPDLIESFCAPSPLVHVWLCTYGTDCRLRGWGRSYIRGRLPSEHSVLKDSGWREKDQEKEREREWVRARERRTIHKSHRGVLETIEGFWEDRSHKKQRQLKGLGLAEQREWQENYSTWKMKDSQSMLEEGRAGEQKGSRREAPMAWFRNEVVRVGLAETLGTFVMMVRACPATSNFIQLLFNFIEVHNMIWKC